MPTAFSRNPFSFGQRSMFGQMPNQTTIKRSNPQSGLFGWVVAISLSPWSSPLLSVYSSSWPPKCCKWAVHVCFTSVSWCIPISIYVLMRLIRCPCPDSSSCPLCYSVSIFTIPGLVQAYPAWQVLDSAQVGCLLRWSSLSNFHP